MKATNIEIGKDGKTIITTETSRFLRKPKIRKFVASEKIVGNYYKWLELPDNLLVTDLLSFQLDSWKTTPPIND